MHFKIDTKKLTFSLLEVASGGVGAANYISNSVPIIIAVVTDFLHFM